MRPIDESPPSPSSHLQKLLQSHSSIYNVLNNPELDSPVVPANQNEDHNTLSPSYIDTSPRFSPDAQFSTTSWQSVENEPIPSSSIPMKQFSSSILSSISDDENEDCGTTIIVPYPKKVMVFETDEEDEDENLTLTHHSGFAKKISPSVPNSIVQNSFIMPTMTVSNSKINTKQTPVQKVNKSTYKLDSLSIIVVTSPDYVLEAEILIMRLRANVNPSAKLLILKNSEYLEEKIQDSDLIFIINDGNNLILEKLSTIFIAEERNNQICSPKITIINMIPTNYFANLFELINLLNPYQIWKTSSLKNGCFIKKLETFISEGQNIKINSNPPLNLNLENNQTLSLIHSGNSLASRNTTIYSSLVSTSARKRKNYKLIERKFKSELQSSISILNNSDPLQLSNKCIFMNIAISFLDDIKFNSNLNDKAWTFCTFTLGIGLGVGITNGMVAILGKKASQKISLIWGNTVNSQLNDVANEKPSLFSSTDGFISFVKSKFTDFTQNFFISVEAILHTFTFNSILKVDALLKSSLDCIKSLNSFIIQYIHGGIEKSLGLLLCINF